MKLELKSVKYFKSFSEETPAYTAILFVDGKKAAHISNNGHGGPDEQMFIDRALGDKVDKYFESLPKIKAFGFELDQSLEQWCQNEVSIQEQMKYVKRLLKKKTIGILGTKEYTWKITPQDFEQHKLYDKAAAQYPGIQFLHRMNDEQFREFCSKE